MSFKKRKNEKLEDDGLKSGEIVFEDEDFKFEYVWNDGIDDNLITLCDLKQIFVACLPKMGLKYVTRHVFDRNHRSLCCRSVNKKKLKLNHNENKIESVLLLLENEVTFPNFEKIHCPCLKTHSEIP